MKKPTPTPYEQSELDRFLGEKIGDAPERPLSDDIARKFGLTDINDFSKELWRLHELRIAQASVVGVTTILDQYERDLG